LFVGLWVRQLLYRPCRPLSVVVAHLVKQNFLSFCFSSGVIALSHHLSPLCASLHALRGRLLVHLVRPRVGPSLHYRCIVLVSWLVFTFALLFFALVHMTHYCCSVFAQFAFACFLQIWRTWSAPVRSVLCSVICAYRVPSGTCRIALRLTRRLSALITTFLRLVALCCAKRGAYLHLSQPIWQSHWSFAFILGWLLACPCSSLSSHAAYSHPSSLSCHGCCS